MSDLIKRQDAIDYCYALINAENPSDPTDEWNYSQERINQTEVILHHLEFMPSAQPEIIRCKYCKHRPIEDQSEGVCPFVDCNDGGAYTVIPEDDFYCASAERKEE